MSLMLIDSIYTYLIIILRTGHNKYNNFGQLPQIKM